MDKDTILNYVTETPRNTNRAVLGSMLDSMSSGGDEMLVVGLTAQTGSYDFTTDKTYDEIAESIYNGNYNIVLAGLNNIAGGKVFMLSTINTDYRDGSIDRLVFSSIDASTGSSVTIASLWWAPSNSNTVSGYEKNINLN